MATTGLTAETASTVGVEMAQVPTALVTVTVHRVVVPVLMTTVPVGMGVAEPSDTL